jgi:LmbE family N-acetylglucosaminyl deacetylase
MEAIDLAGVAFEYRSLGAPDRRASFAMAEYTLKFAKILRTSWPDVVLSHAYEGGHADHDAAAFVAHHACRLTGIAPLWEMTGYHAAQGQRNAQAATLSGVPVVSGAFLSPSEPRGNAVRVPLDLTTARLKRRMLDRFESQRKALADLRIDLSYEMFRPAPVYDFALPPHAGRLLYDTQNWTRLKGEQWRLLAREAAAALELAPRSVPAVNSLPGRARL